MLFLIYKHTDDHVSDDFQKIFNHFPKIFKVQKNVPEHFPKIAEEFQGGPEDVSMIHQCLSTIEPFCGQVVPRWRVKSSGVRQSRIY